MGFWPETLRHRSSGAAASGLSARAGLRLNEADFYILDAAADWQEFFLRFAVQRQQFGDLFLAIGMKETTETLAAQLDMTSSNGFIEFACLPEKPAEDPLLAAAAPACRLVLASPDSVLSESSNGKKLIDELLSRTVILLPDMLARFLDDQALAELLIHSAPRLTLIAGPDEEQLPLARRCYRMLKDRHFEDTQFKLNYHDLRKTRKAT